MGNRCCKILGRLRAVSLLNLHHAQQIVEPAIVRILLSCRCDHGARLIQVARFDLLLDGENCLHVRGGALGDRG